MKLYRKLRKRGTKTASGPSSGPSSDTRTDETRNSPKSAGRVDEPSQPSDIPGPNPADEIPATPVAKTEDTPQSNVHPSPLVVESAAEKALSEAAENLNTKIQKCGMDASEFKLKPIRASYDMNSIAHSLEICLEGIMDKADVSVSNKNAVKTFAKDWGRKAIPFIEKGLDVAEDVIPAPYNLVLIGVLFVVKAAKSSLGLDEAIRNILTDLSQAIGSVKIDLQILDQGALDMMRDAALYLTASILDCLGLVLVGVTQSVAGKLFNAPDVATGKQRVKDQLTLYTTATSTTALSLQLKAVRDKDHEGILEWVCPRSKSESYKSPLRDDLVEGACEWFLRSPEYTNWAQVLQKSIARANDIVSAGAGKSYLVSVIFDQLKSTPRLGILYFIFNHAIKDQRPKDVARLLLRQVLRQLKQNIPESVKVEYKKHKDDEHAQTTHETFTTLLKDSVCQLAHETSNDVFVLVDAFDEFQTKGNERAERKRLQKCLHALTETKTARLLITTRPEPLESLRSTFKTAVHVEIRADPSDIDKYIDKEMDGYTGLRNVELKDSLKSRVKESSEGLFLLATLQTTYVLETLDAKQRRHRLRSLPSTPENAYREILQDRLTEAERTFAKQILSWIFYARRPLKMAELQEALAIEPGEEELIISGAEDIVRSCGSLVKHDTFTDKVEFTHELVRKFIEDHQSEFVVKESAITLICLACINSILRGPLRNKAIALFDYAREFWGEHLRNMENDRSVEVELKIFEIFCNPLQAPAEETPYTPVDLDRYFVQVLAEYGVGFILTRPLPDERIADCISKVPVDFPKGSAGEILDSAIPGDLELARWVLERAGDSSECDDSSWKWVAENRHLELMRLFFLNASKLDWKAWRTLYSLRRDFVEIGISRSQILSQVNEQDDYGLTALHRASHSPDNYCIFQWLVEEFNADFNIPNRHGFKPILILIPKMMDGEFLEWLVRKLKVEYLGHPPRPVLHWAARIRNRELIDWLVHVKMVDVNQVDSRGITALLVYLQSSDAPVDNDICRWLAGDGKSLTQETDRSPGPLLVYLEKSGAELDVVKEWVNEKGADITAAVDPRGTTALDIAILAGRLDFVKWLVDEKGEDVTNVNVHGDSPLMIAVASGNSEIVKWLVEEKGADVKEVGNAFGQTARRTLRWPSW